MSNESWRSSLSVLQYLGLLTSFVALPLIGLAFYVISGVAKAERETTRAGLLGNARLLAAAVDREIDKHIAVASTLAHSQSLLSGDFHVFWKQAREALTILPSSWLIVADPNGKQLVNTLRRSDEALPFRPASTLVRQSQAFETRMAQVSDVYMGAVAQRPIVTIDMPVFRNGAPLYIIGIPIDPKGFSKLLSDQKYPPDWYAGVLDRKGDIIARLRDPDGRSIGTPASATWRRSIEKSSEDIVENISLEGQALVNAYTTTRNGWIVGVGISKAALDAPVWRLQLLFAGIGAICVGLSLSFAGSSADDLTTEHGYCKMRR
jgi:hypothetical protein